MRKNYLMKSVSIILMLLAMMFSCDQPADVGSNNSNQQTNENQGNQNGENTGGDNNEDNKPANPQALTLQQIINDTNAGEEIDLSKYKDVTDYNATVNKSLTIKNGALKNAKLSVTAENVKLEKLEKLSVSTSSRLTINNSKLNDLLIGNATSESRASVADISMAMVSVAGCEIENVELNGFNSQLNIADATTKIDDIVTSTKSKIILEAGSYDGMKDPVVEDNGELTRIDMTKDKELSVLSIYSNPKKAEYKLNEEIDLTGLIVMGTYTASVEIFKSGGWKGEAVDSVTKWESEKDYTVTCEDFSTAGVKIVTITSNIDDNVKSNFFVYVKDSQNSEIKEPEITDITIKSLGTPKTLYRVGEKLDLSGFQVSGTYNGFEINLPYRSEPVYGEQLTAENTQITFYYNDKIVGTKEITVTEPCEVEFYDGIGESTLLYMLKMVTGESLKLPVEPKRDDYTFAGWYNGETKVEAGDIVYDNLNLIAKWEGYTYIVKFDANGGSGEMADMTFTYDVEQALAVNTFTREDYTFAGWATTAESDVTYTDMGKVKNLTAEDKSTVTLYAVWNENDKILPVIFSVASETAVDCGDIVTLSCATEGVKISYTIDGVTAEYTDAIVITKDVIITAFATKDGMKDSDITTASYTVKTYTVTYKSDYGTVPSEINGLKKGDTLTEVQLAGITTTGYTFAGWYNGESEVTIEYKIIGDLELSAKWTANTDTAYKVEHYQQNIADDEYTIAEDDTENKTGTTDEDAFATAKDYAGFTVKSVTQEKIAADGSTVVKIYYDRNTITLTLDLDGGDGKTEITGKYGAVVTTPANPTKTGYTFAGWNPDLPATLPADNAEYTATWLELYKITYDLDGGINAQSNPASYTVETETIKLADATKDGYTFLGWYDENGDKLTQITKETTGNITLYAKWWDPTDFVYVDGVTITERIGNSEIFSGSSVTVSNFYISDHEVTQAEYTKYYSYVGSSPSSTYGVGDNYPAYYVSWYDALVYCNIRSTKEGLTPCYTINDSTDPTDWGAVPTSSNDIWNKVTCDFTANGYRLPTEAEWEYAARGGGDGLTGTQDTYAGSDTIGDVAWYYDNSENKTHEVKKKAANGLGLYDMTGNVHEWCWDLVSGVNHRRRGGNYGTSADLSKVYYRSDSSVYGRFTTNGFRVVCTAN